MIYEAKVIGASAVLLICAILDDEQLASYLRLAHELGMSALVEAHDEEEVRRAIACGAGIIGVNNRDLRTFTVDIMNSVRLRKLIPDTVPATHMGTEVPVTGTGAAADTLVPQKMVYVSESGIKAKEDIDRLKANGTDARILVEHLCEFSVELRIILIFLVSLFQLQHRIHQSLWNVLAAVNAKSAF